MDLHSLYTKQQEVIGKQKNFRTVYHMKVTKSTQVLKFASRLFLHTPFLEIVENIPRLRKIVRVFSQRNLFVDSIIIGIESSNTS